MMMRFKEDALHYAQLIREQKVSVETLVTRSISLIKANNDKYRAVSHLQEVLAINTARQMDAYIQGLTQEECDLLPRFYGVPTLLKDLGQEQAGQPNSCGAKLMAHYIAPDDDAFVTQVKSLGFVIIGRSNTPEFGFKNISDSKLNGTVLSAFSTKDIPRHAGGSSGGAVTALKLGWVPIVFASDGGGSIRIPASFNGVIGLKPTRGRVPVGPTNYRGWQGASVNFALTKSVRDTWALLIGMQSHTKASPFMIPLIDEEGELAELEFLPRHIRVAYTYHSPIGREVNQEAKQGVLNVVNFLTKHGFDVVEDEPDLDHHQLMRDYYVMNSVETANMMHQLSISLDRPIVKDDMELMSWAIYQAGLKIPAYEYSEILNRWDRYTAKTEAFYEMYDIFISPSTAKGAPRLNQFDLSDDLHIALNNIEYDTQEKQAQLVWEMFAKSLDWTPYTQQQNLVGGPAMSLPLAYTNEGLPLGIQLSASKGKEKLLLQIARFMEKMAMLNVTIVEESAY